ncbi:UDP-2,3-diacylglucosamine diphosphatase [Neisseria sp. Ec49-e6-T10]|uniref:UDP-2,3-diacylglucosamine diphosphatase n=1 Tax=Neisseria sp. Ec49-e6-T10 TaxID=3140744 RepID=UPI003EC0BBDC
MSQTILMADLHLSEETPKLNKLFKQCLNEWQGKIDALYILGDFFEYWIGDDDSNPFIETVLSQLKAFAQHTPTYVMHGNRDFLLGDGFEAKTGVKIITDPSLVNLYGKEYVLSHGDILCTDDLPYQQFRAQSRNPAWQSVMLSKPLAERKVLAMQLRQMSEGVKAANGKTSISDATEVGVEQLMKPFIEGKASAPTFIHGHTHRPDIHEHSIAGHAFKRYVLQDWYSEKAGYLVVSEGSVDVKELTV